MKRKNMFSKLIYPAAAFAGAVLLAACSADELGMAGGSTVIPPTSEGVSSGTVEFTNNTSVTVGNLSSITRSSLMTRGAAFDFEGNNACTLGIDRQPEITDEGSVIENNGEETTWAGDITGKNLTVKAGATCNLTGPSGRKITGDVYVYGTFNLESYCSNGSGEHGRIIVYDGGTLNINDLKNQDLSGISVLNYGGTININVSGLAIGSTAELMTTGDFDCETSDLTVNGKLYVGGNMTFKNITSETDGAQIHVLGSLNGTPEYAVGTGEPYADADLTLRNNAGICVEGGMFVRTLTASAGACVHADCKLVALDERNSSFNITNGATLCASYVEGPLLHVSGGEAGAAPKVYLPDQGVIDVKKLIVGNSNILPYKEAADALVEADNITVEDKIKWDDVFAPALYVNYGEITAFDDQMPADTTKHNAATIKDGILADCSPGFTPEPGGGGDIVMKLPSGIFDDYGLHLRADDFAIRVDGEYVEDIKVSGDTASLNGLIKIIDDRLAITVSGLSYENILDDTDYTYEIWMWVSNKKLLDDGTGSYGQLFSTGDYLRWIGLSADTGLPVDYASPGYEAGVDYTEQVQSVTSPEGYEVRYNVYRGLGGHVDKGTGLGDTPYIKVSIHVRKNVNAPADTAVGVYPTAE